jgi:hypothetical protein
MNERAVYHIRVSPNGAWTTTPESSKDYDWELVALLLNDLINYE